MAPGEIIDTADPAGRYTIMGMTGFFDRFFHLLYRLGMQTAILVSARYANAQAGAGLTEPAVLSALRKTLERYPVLATAAVFRPSQKRGKHELYRALFHEVDMREHVEFIDDEGASAGAEFFERIHNEWPFMADEPTGPLFKLYVLGRRDVVFVYSHFLCDGKSGYIFHRTFLEALNAEPQPPAAPDPIVRFDPDKARLAKPVSSYIRERPSLFYILWTSLFWPTIRFAYRGRLFFDDAPTPRPYPQTPMGCAAEGERTVSVIETFRIPADRMKTVLAACRARGTTFTPLFIVAVSASLATGRYPRAQRGFTFCSTDGRPVLEFPEGEDGAQVMGNLAGGLFDVLPLDPLRRAHGAAVAGHQEAAAAGALPPAGSADGIWRLVKEYKARMDYHNSSRPGSRVKTILASSNLLGTSVEDMVYQAFPALGSQQQNGVAFSNLAPFPAADAGGKLGEEGGPAWRIDDVQFSTSVVGGSVSHNGLRFNMAGLRGGDTVVSAAWEEGVMSREAVREVWEGTMRCVDAMVAAAPGEGWSSAPAPAPGGAGWVYAVASGAALLLSVALYHLSRN